MTNPYVMDGGGAAGTFTGEPDTRPSAILSLLGELTMPPVQSATPSAPTGGLLSSLPAPHAPPVQAPTPPPSQHMLQRIVGLLGKVGGGVSNALVGDAPQGYEGLLSPEEIQKARPHFLQALIGAPNAPSPQARWEQNLNAIINRHVAASQIATAKTAEMEKQRVLAQRAKIGAMYPSLPTDTPQQTIHTLLKQYDEYVRAGDVEMAGRVGEVLKSMGDVLQGPKAGATKNPIELRLGDHVELLDPDTRKPISSYKINPSPRDPNAPDTASQLRDQRMFQREQQLGDDFNKDTKTYRELYQKLNNAVAEVPRALNGDGAAQTNLLYAFVNAMDPASAVREGEIGLVQSAAPLRARAQQMISKYLETGKSSLVPKDMVHAMGDLLERRKASTQDYVKERADYYGGRAKKWGVDASAFPGIGDVPAPQAPVTPTAPPASSALRAKYDAAAAHLTAQGKTPAQIRAMIGDRP